MSYKTCNHATDAQTDEAPHLRISSAILRKAYFMTLSANCACSSPAYKLSSRMLVNSCLVYVAQASDHATAGAVVSSMMTNLALRLEQAVAIGIALHQVPAVATLSCLTSNPQASRACPQDQALHPQQDCRSPQAKRSSHLRDRFHPRLAVRSRAG